MDREIRLSKKAAKSLNSLLVYLEQEWSKKSKNECILKLNQSLRQIQNLPESFPESEKIKGLRECVVTKQTTFFYKYSDATIDIVMLLDNRQNPQ